MSTRTHILGEERHVRIRCQDDEPSVWIDTAHATVSLTLTAEQLDALIVAATTARVMLRSQAVLA